MRKFLIILLVLCLGIGIAYAAPRKPKKNAKKTNVVEVCDPNDPTCFLKKDIVVEKTCGRGRALRVAGMIGNAPFGWVEADRINRQNMQSFGLGRVVLEKIKDDLDIRFVSTGYTSYEEAILALRKGEIDLLLAVYHRTALGKEVEIVTPAYFKNYFTVYFKKGNELPIESYQDLVGLKGIVRKEEMIYPMIYQRLPRGVQLTEVLSAAKAFEMLMNEEVDYILGSPYALEGELRRYKMQDDIVSDGAVLGTATLFFAISKNSPCYSLKEDISTALKEHNFSQKTLRDDIQQLIDDWGKRFYADEALIKTKNNTRSEELEEVTDKKAEHKDEKSE